MPTRLVHQIDIKIFNQDWDKIRAGHTTLAQKIQNNTLSNDTLSKEVYNSAGSIYKFTQYNLSSFGSILRSDSGLSTDWDTWCGPMLYRLCPWYTSAKKIFKNLNFQAMTYSITHEDIKLHVDPKIDEEKMFGQSKINYIVSADDPSAKTLVYDKKRNVTAHYPSIPGTAWLLNTNFPHEVKCKGKREVIQFKFLNDYDEVLAELKNIGPIQFGLNEDS